LADHKKFIAPDIQRLSTSLESKSHRLSDCFGKHSSHFRTGITTHQNFGRFAQSSFVEPQGSRTANVLHAARFNASIFGIYFEHIWELYIFYYLNFRK